VNAKEATLYWSQRKHQLTVPLGASNNVATFHMAPGCDKFEAFCTEIEADLDDVNPIVMDAEVVEDDNTVATFDDSWEPKEGVAISEGDPPFMDGPTNAKGKETPSLVVSDENDRQPTSDAADLLKLHHRFGHISFKRLQEMAKQGTVPMRLAKCPIPVCTACMFAKATKRKWRDKTRLAGDAVKKASRPGQVVSVDQMVSPTPGLIAQMTGFLTNKRYKSATVYVDQYSRHGFVYLQKTASAEETP